MWDLRVWVGSNVEDQSHTNLKLSKMVFSGFSLMCISHNRSENLECWEEIAVAGELCRVPWVTCGDFNNVRIMVEKRGCGTITNVMTDFSRWIKDMELHDPCINGGNSPGSEGLLQCC